MDPITVSKFYAIGIQFERSKLERTADLRDQLALDGMETARFSE